MVTPSEISFSAYLRSASIHRFSELRQDRPAAHHQTMTYPGNSELSDEIRRRIQNTFHQTLDLSSKGSRQEALLGCDFILRLDPLFEPARTLQGRLQEADGAVEVDDLATWAQADEVAVESPAPDEESAAADETQVAAAPADDKSAEEAAGDQDLSEPSTQEPDAGPDLAEQLQRMLQERNFDAIEGLVEWHKDRIAADAELQQLVQSARERREAEPYVQSFLESARKAHTDGDGEAAALALRKALELDESHPEARKLQREIGQSAAPASADVSAADEPEISLDEPETSAQPTASLDTESEARITELLTEGQEAFEQGEYQAAIDAWSRIFLIDIDHAEANRRIELARKLKAEVERKIEEAFHEGLSRLQSSAIDDAREAFQLVLEMQPSHLAAQEYLDKIESGELTPGGSPAAAEEEAHGEAEPALSVPEIAVQPAAPDSAERESAEAIEAEGDFYEETPSVVAGDLLPEEWGAPARPKRTLLTIAAGVLVLVLAGGWFLVSKWDSIFPNSTEPTAPSAPRPDPITRATELHKDGQTQMAIAQLRRLPPTDAQYAEAQVFIAQWESSETSTGQEPAGPSEEQLEQQEALIEEARRAVAGTDNLRASELLQRAASIAPLDESAGELRATAQQRLDLVEPELRLFQQGDWEYALPNLWRLHEANPRNRDIRQLIVDSYFNLGLRDLQRGDPVSGSEKLAEATNLTSDDAELNRLSTFAQVYKERPSDLLYRIYVKYQPFR